MTNKEINADEETHPFYISEHKKCLSYKLPLSKRAQNKMSMLARDYIWQFKNDKLEELLEKGMDPDNNGSFNRWPLTHEAAECCNAKAIILLYEYGATTLNKKCKRNKKDKEGLTPTEIAKDISDPGPLFYMWVELAGALTEMESFLAPLKGIEKPASSKKRRRKTPENSFVRQEIERVQRARLLVPCIEDLAGKEPKPKIRTSIRRKTVRLRVVDSTGPG